MPHQLLYIYWLHSSHFALSFVPFSKSMISLEFMTFLAIFQFRSYALSPQSTFYKPLYSNRLQFNWLLNLSTNFFLRWFCNIPKISHNPTIICDLFSTIATILHP